MIPLSVLDFVPVGPGDSASGALHGATDVARAAERLGFRRFWVAEFHNSSVSVSTSPPVVLAHVAASTSRIRVGSGAMLLPYHRPLALAEQFGTLAALHPGRVDLGVGRGPGTDRRTARLLAAGDDGYADRVREVLHRVEGGPGPDGHAVRTPGAGAGVPVWMLGSSSSSADLAAGLGMPYAFGHHLAPARTAAALRRYRDGFRPSGTTARPYTMVCVQTVCGESDEHARALATPPMAAAARASRGGGAELPTVDEAAAFGWTDAERDAIAQARRAQAVGSPATVAARMREIADACRPDEIMVIALVADAGERIRGLERIVAELGQPAVIDDRPVVSGANHDGLGRLRARSR